VAPGATGNPGLYYPVVAGNSQALTGLGASGCFGAGGQVTTANGSGINATGFGGGGGGGYAANIVATAAGGNGSPGIVIITELCVN
jgi:hypothetical protein